jgi:tetrapyrrole methylase family protein/MazG family protein
MPVGITIAGLGPGPRDTWTVAAQRALTEASEVFLNPTYQGLAAQIPAPIRSLDSGAIPLTPEQFAQEVLRLGQRQAGVVVAVPGNPAVDDSTVPLIRTMADKAGIPLRIIPGLSLLDAAFGALTLETTCNVQIIEADRLTDTYHPLLEPDRPALVTRFPPQVDLNRLQSTLLNAYPADLHLTAIYTPGTETEHTKSGPLTGLATLPVPDALYLPADTHHGFSAFQATIAHLRAPEGCPWDQKQTHQSLRPYLLEETYEVLEAMDANDPDGLAEELGDLLLQVVLHTQVAIDNGTFKMRDVVNHIDQKLLRRHPHVFGDVVVNGVDEVTTNWDAIKKAEKAARGDNNSKPPSALDGVPAAQPALAQALSISKRAVRIGFEWPNIDGVLDKIVEEAHEVATATNPEHLESEIGDLLFSVVNLARWQNIDPESALRSTNSRFGRRFRQLEQLAAAQGNNLADMSIDEMDILWEQAKQIEKNARNHSSAG